MRSFLEFINEARAQKPNNIDVFGYCLVNLGKGSMRCPSGFVQLPNKACRAVVQGGKFVEYDNITDDNAEWTIGAQVDSLVKRGVNKDIAKWLMDDYAIGNDEERSIYMDLSSLKLTPDDFKQALENVMKFISKSTQIRWYNIWVRYGSRYLDYNEVMHMTYFSA